MNTQMLTNIPVTSEVRGFRQVRDLAAEFPRESPDIQFEMSRLNGEHGVRLRCVAAMLADGVLWFMCFDETSLLRAINGSDESAKAAWICVERLGAIH